MKVMTLFGTRPEIIRLCCIIETVDQFCEQIIVHTGQNYDTNLSAIFFRELGLRPPDVHMGIQCDRFAAQVGQILTQAEQVLEREKPDRLLILGDTNSGLAAIAAARMGIPVYHMEAGNRCYDNRVPEEINRRIIDQCSNVLMPYTQRSKENLLREGIERERIFVIGNPIYEVIQKFLPQIDQNGILDRLELSPQGYFLATLHRAENVDEPERLKKLLEGLQLLNKHYDRPVIVSLHPRTKEKLKHFRVPVDGGIHLLAPMSFIDFVALERQAFCVVSDSGTVQEECSIFQLPSVTIRDVTERPETIECGSNILSGAEPEMILKAAQLALSLPAEWNPPAEYLVEQVSSIVTKILLGYRPG